MLKQIVLLLGVAAFALGGRTAVAEEYCIEVSGGAKELEDNLLCRVGLLKEDGTIDWGNKVKVGKGRAPCVTLEGKTAVLVNKGHTTETKDDLYYRVGTVDLSSMSIAWGPEVKYGKGDKPFVSLKGTRVVEVHQASDKKDLWLITGTIEVQRQQILFKEPVKYDPDGENPTIALEMQQ